MKFAIIEAGGKQYKVEEGSKIRIEKHASQDGACTFDHVLLSADGKTVHVGQPYIEGAVVEGKVLKEGRDKKKIVFKYHSKNRFRKKHGHRQPYTEVEITAIR